LKTKNKREEWKTINEKGNERFFGSGMIGGKKFKGSKRVKLTYTPINRKTPNKAESSEGRKTKKETEEALVVLKNVRSLIFHAPPVGAHFSFR